MATGNRKANSGDVLRPFAERWNGSSWTLFTGNLSPAGSIAAQLSGVSCTSRSSCIAVGSYQSANGPQLTLAERWNGTTWTIQATPNLPGGGTPSLSGVSCSSATACTAVGSDFDSNSNDASSTTLAERWNGSNWIVQGTPNPGVDDELANVSCSSPTACTAIGTQSVQGFVTTPFAEGWNGATWTAQTIPAPVSGTASDFTLSGVSCTSPSACTAVGNHDTPGGPEVTIAERWNGTRWTEQSTPNPSSATNSYFGGNGLPNAVSCKSSTACTAVGLYTTNTNGASGVSTLAEHWNGTSWSIQTTPSPPPTQRAPALSAVSCATESVCEAVGTTTSTGSGASTTLAERYK